MQYKYIIIDAQNLYWRAVMSSLKKFIDKEDDKVYTNSIRDFLDRMNELKNRFGNYNSNIYLLFDNPTSIIQKRKTIDVTYKHTREKKNVPKNFYKTLDVLQEILKNYKDNLYIIKYDELEADDLVYPLLQEINVKNKDIPKLVISADLDWARAIGVDNNCSWYNYVEIYNKDNFTSHYEFSPLGKKIQMYKTFKGDNSDAIPNAVPYLPKEILLDILEKYNNVDDLLKDIMKTTYKQDWKIKINEASSRLKANYRLVDYFIYDKLDNYIFKCRENIKKLRYFFELYDLQFENRMFDKKKDNFFEVKEYKRLK